MMREERVANVTYDTQRDTVRLVCDASGDNVTSKRTRSAVQLLLDANGALVGVDLGGAGFQRTVVMIGPHEAVSRVEAWEADVVRDANGNVLEVAFSDARARAKADQKNPYS